MKLSKTIPINTYYNLDNDELIINNSIKISLQVKREKNYMYNYFIESHILGMRTHFSSSVVLPQDELLRVVKTHLRDFKLNILKFA